MRARTMLLLILGMVLLDWVMRRPGISVAGHLGGIAAGALLVSGLWRPSRLLALLGARRRDPRRVYFERRDGDDDRDGGRGPWVN